MTIKIIDEEMPIYLTQAEHDRLQQEYQNFMRFHCGAMSFETYVRNSHLGKGRA